ncbi:MAG TPA: hypothetical protein VEO54_09780 [Thermoanaerobaculia bacterium]|nr:hypothetical protein [Thermoanaerobaculia bacterium]
MPHRPRRRPRPEWNRIRELFLGRRESYATTELPALLGIAAAAVQQAIDDKTITPIPVGRELRVVWEDVVTLALEHRWTSRLLTDALRRFPRAPLPPLLRVTPARVTLPRYQWHILRLLAARQSRADRRDITVSDLLEQAVTTAFIMRIEDWEELEKSLPGVSDTVSWPSGE